MKQNGINILSFYDSVEKQNHKNWWAFDRAFCLATPLDHLLPFQIAITSGQVSQINIVNKETAAKTNIFTNFFASGGEIRTFDDYLLVIYPGTVPLGANLPLGQYYVEILESDAVTWWYSEVFTFVPDLSDYIEMEYWHNDPVYYKGGHVLYEPPFKMRVFINSDIAKPKYEYEERVITRDGVNMPIQQISYKLHRFAMLAPEFLIDSLRLARQHDNVIIKYRGNIYEVDELLMNEVNWQVQGDLAEVELEFKTETIVINGRGKKKIYDVIDGTCIPVIYNAVAEIGAFSFDYYNARYSINGETKFLGVGDYAIIRNGENRSLNQWAPGYQNVGLSDGTTVWDAKTNDYWFYDSSLGSLTSIYISGFNGNFAFGRTFPNTMVNIYLVDDFGGELLAATGTYLEFNGAGIEFDFVPGYTGVKAVALSGKCGAFESSAVVPYVVDCLPGVLDLPITLLNSQVLNLNNYLTGAQTGGQFAYMYNYLGPFNFANFQPIPDPANFVVPGAGIITTIYYINDTCYAIDTAEVLAVCDGMNFIEGDCMVYADGDTMEYSI